MVLYAKWTAGSGGGIVSGSGTEEDPYINTDTTYDPDDVEEGVTTYVNIPGEPQTTVDENGEITDFEFTNTGNGIPFDDTSTLDTGIYAFDGHVFTIHIKFTVDVTDTNNERKYIISALEKNANNQYSGFSIYIFKNNKGNCYLYGGTYVDRARSTTTGLLNPNYSSSILKTNVTGVATYDVTITYDPIGYKSSIPQLTYDTTVVGTSNTKVTTFNNKNSTQIPTNLSNATITLGGDGINSTENIDSMTILEFSVTKVI